MGVAFGLRKRPAGGAVARAHQPIDVSVRDDALYLTPTRVASESQYQDLVSALHGLSLDPPAHAKWVVDLSQVGSITLPLVNLLVALRDQLEDAGRTVHITGFERYATAQAATSLGGAVALEQREVNGYGR